MNKLYKKIDDTYWFYPCSEKELNQILEDNMLLVNKKNLRHLVKGIAAYLQEYEYENGSIDNNVAKFIGDQ